MNFLYKLGILLAIMLSSLLGLAQSKADKLYDTFSGKDGIVTLSFSKSVIKPLEIFMDDDTKKVIYKMKKISFMSYNENKGDLYAFNVYERILKELKGGSYFRIDPEEFDCDDCDIDIEGDDVIFIGHGVKKDMDEFHIVAFDNEMCLLFSFYGDITVDDLKECGRFSSTTKGIFN